ncbi:DUF4244 domain-containing protein [Falsarthrobacter nasiphocae]|uniref:DUF4244 domain-containing protein n=1 Tax=Falsarthrobacter nasiphocae TaxID=189863 RepID=A0AAE3YHK9_9MICC|nr:DUF4244 domain-containing protein [Falsarthrobacter nasiphocae]MDR6892355.1 hypothetical protein [Falsarthrobacter nasiphocae]
MSAAVETELTAQTLTPAHAQALTETWSPAEPGTEAGAAALAAQPAVCPGTDACGAGPEPCPECEDPDAGATTAEYAILTLAAVAFAGVLAVVVKSGAVQALLQGVIERALNP